jgi:hypothetical protein
MYYQGDGYRILAGSKYHLGNLGQALPWCGSMRYEGNYKVECGAGALSELKYLGLKPDANPAPKWPSDFCGPLDAWHDIKTCSLDHIDFEGARSHWNKICLGKK